MTTRYGENKKVQVPYLSLKLSIEKQSAAFIKNKHNKTIKQMSR
jgi:hypothetical protein